MSSPRAIADKVESLGTGLWHWWVPDERIQFRSEAYAVDSPEGAVLLDPLPLAAAAARSLGVVAAVCLTVEAHQRAAWDWRSQLGVPVHAPVGAEGLEEAPDYLYASGDLLPGGLRALAAPGPRGRHHAFFLDRLREPGAMFTGDLLTREEEERVVLTPEEHLADKAAALESLRTLLQRRFETLCLGHGPPVLSGGEAAMRNALKEAAGT